MDAADFADLGPVRCATLATPAVDRLFRCTMRAVHERGGDDLVRCFGGSRVVGGLVEYRTALAHPGRVVTRAQYTAVCRCCHPDLDWSTVEAQAAAGVLEIVNGGFRATIAGLDFLRELYRLHAEVTAELWRGHGDRVARLVAALGRVLAAAGTASGDGAASAGAAGAYAAMAPAHEPAGAPLGVVLLNRLDNLRYFRADAFAVACASAGLTPAEAASLGPDPRQRAIDVGTDQLVGRVYAALNPEARLILLADLAALP